MKLLFLCTGNSCRSQMAEGWARKFAPPHWRIASAGIEAHGRNPHAIEVMREAGVDISDQASTRLSDAMLQEADVLITVCGHADEHCPVVPPGIRKEHWPLPDPARTTGSEAAILGAFRDARDDIRRRVLELIERLEHDQPSSS